MGRHDVPQEGKERNMGQKIKAFSRTEYGPCWILFRKVTKVVIASYILNILPYFKLS